MIFTYCDHSSSSSLCWAKSKHVHCLTSSHPQEFSYGQNLKSSSLAKWQFHFFSIMPRAASPWRIHRWLELLDYPSMYLWIILRFFQVHYLPWLRCPNICLDTWRKGIILSYWIFPWEQGTCGAMERGSWTCMPIWGHSANGGSLCSVI